MRVVGFRDGGIGQVVDMGSRHQRGMKGGGGFRRLLQSATSS